MKTVFCTEQKSLKSFVMRWFYFKTKRKSFCLAQIVSNLGICSTAWLPSESHLSVPRNAWQPSGIQTDLNPGARIQLSSATSVTMRNRDTPAVLAGSY